MKQKSGGEKREREKVSDQSGPKSCKEKKRATCIEYSKFKPREGFRELLFDTKSELGPQLLSGQKPQECSPLTLSPRVVPASVRRTAGELPAGSLVSNTLSSGSAQKNFPLPDSG